MDTCEGESTSGPADARARPVGINHVAIEVGDVDEALEFYGTLFEFDLRGRTESSAYLDMGDQFLALAEAEIADADREGHRHFGLVVDDPGAVDRRLAAVEDAGVRTNGADFRDPWGNWIQVVAYEEVQFTKAEHVLRGMGLDDLGKAESAIAELAEKGLAPE